MVPCYTTVIRCRHSSNSPSVSLAVPSLLRLPVRQVFLRKLIKDASDIVGSDYIQSDKYLQDIVRDKRYWEGKRQTIHQHEKSLEGHIQRYETNLEEIERERKAILRRAQQQAEELLAEANRKIENTIREIKEAQAEKERTRLVREELQQFREQVVNDDTRGLMSEEDFAKKLRQMEERKARKEKRKNEKAQKEERAAAHLSAVAKAPSEPHTITVGSTVRMKGLNTIGKVENISGKQATVVFGEVRTKVKLEQLEYAEKPKEEKKKTTILILPSKRPVSPVPLSRTVNIISIRTLMCGACEVTMRLMP